jgi:hypothetical protein
LSGFFVSENRHRVATVTAIVRPSLNQSRSASSRALLESVSGAAPFAVDNGQQHPPIFARTADFAAESLFGSQTERARAALEAIIYAKTNDYILPILWSPSNVPAVVGVFTYLGRFRRA